MKRKASKAMEYFAAATQQQQNNTYKPLPATLASMSAPPTSNTSSSPPSRPSASSAVSTSSIPAFLTELLPSSALSAAYHSKLHNKFLQLAATEVNTTAASTNTAQPIKQRQQQKRKAAAGKKGSGQRTAARPLTAKQRKQLKLLSLPQLPTALRYSAFLPLHRLWLAYIRDLLAQPHSAIPLSSGERLLKADYHGARVTVVRSTAPSYVHVSGIVVQESASGWRIIGEDDKVRLVRKEGSVLQLTISSGVEDEQQQHQLGDWQVELYGDQLTVRSAERAAKKFKGKSNIQMNG